MTSPARFYAGLEKEAVACPLCGGGEFETLARSDRYGMGIVTAGCTRCGLALTNPRPTGAALDRFYRVQYRPLYGKVEAPSDEYIAQGDVGLRAKYAAEHLDGAGLLPSAGRVLDVGCAEGSILRAIAARRPGLDLVGIEPSPTFGAFAVRHAGCRVLPDVDAYERETRVPARLVIVNHVLEHVADPVAFLRRLGDLLAEDGAIYVDVPDASRYSSLIDLHLAHLHHFTPATLAEAGRRAGLAVVSVERHDPPRHPASVRAAFRRAAPGAAASEDVLPGPDEAETARRIRSIGRGAILWHLRERFVVPLLRRLRR